MENVSVIDSTGLRVLTSVVDQCRRQGIRVYLADLGEETRARIADSPLGQSIAPQELSLSFDQVLFALGPTGEMPAGKPGGREER